MFFGVAYGAGEGDLRAAYPGKLTALDALLSGKLFSRNVARSILTGGGICRLAAPGPNGFSSALPDPISAGDGLDTLKSLLISYPILGLIADKVVDAITISTFALLLPVSILRPRIRRNRLFYALLPMFCALGRRRLDHGKRQPGKPGDFDRDRRRSRMPSVFLRRSSGDHQLRSGDAVRYGTFPPQRDFGRMAAVCHKRGSRWRAVLVAANCTLRIADGPGRIAEVRPAYAKFWPSTSPCRPRSAPRGRRSCGCLPDQPPKITGLSIAGSCVPAREVGGDFYDFFPLDDHRVGVFLAEGGNRELGPAMTIAFAKGFLLYTSKLDLSPAELLRRLQETSGVRPAECRSSISMLYAVIDARAGDPVCAVGRDGPVSDQRLGHTPRRYPRNAPPAIPSCTARAGCRRATRFSSTPTAWPPRSKKRRAGRQAQFFARISREIGTESAGELHSAVMRVANKRRQDLAPDDLTAVVIRMENRSELAIEVVA